MCFARKNGLNNQALLNIDLSRPIRQLPVQTINLADKLNMQMRLLLPQNSYPDQQRVQWVRSHVLSVQNPQYLSQGHVLGTADCYGRVCGVDFGDRAAVFREQAFYVCQFEGVVAAVLACYERDLLNNHVYIHPEHARRASNQLPLQQVLELQHNR